MMDNVEKVPESGTRGMVDGLCVREEDSMKSCTKLAATWTLWAHFQGGERDPKLQQEKDYMQNLQQISDVDNLVSFCQVWNNLPHGNPAGCFTAYDSEALSLVQAKYANNG